jgi:VWFA-related protein
VVVHDKKGCFTAGFTRDDFIYTGCWEGSTRTLSSALNWLGKAVFATSWIGGSVVLAAQVTGGIPVPAQEPVIRVTVNLVQVEAVVTGPDGHPVRDLEPADFEVRENGVWQRITHFSWIQVSPQQPGQTKPAARGHVMARVPPNLLSRQDVHRTIVLMLDDAGTSWEDLVPVISAGKRFVQEQIEPGDLVAVTASRGGMGFYQQLSGDKRQLLAAIERIGARPCWALWNLEVPRGPTTDSSEPNPPLFTLKRGEPPLGCHGPPANPIGYLAWAIQGLRQMPGRKAIFLFTSNPSFPAPPSLIELANRAGVTIHVIDPGGAATSIAPSRSPSRRLALETGGLWVKNAPCCFNATMGGLIEEMRGYYLLGFRPQRNRVEVIAGKPIPPVITVKVLRPGLMVRYKREFTEPPSATTRLAPRTREDLLQDALWSPFSAGAIQVQLTSLYSASPPDGRSKRRNPLLRTIFAIDGSRFEFSDTPEGKKELTLDVAVAVFTPEGQPAGYRDQRLAIVAAPARAREISNDGVTCTLEIPLTEPGPYQVRAAVVLPETQPGGDQRPVVAGSAYEFIEIPDFNKARITLSSIVLSQSADEFTRSRPAWRQFAAGTQVDYSCEVFGVTADPATKSRDVQLEVKLFRQDRLILATPPLAVSIDPNSPKPVLAGSISIPKDLEPGEYSMELLTSDRLAAPKDQVASQWAEMTVTRSQ